MEFILASFNENKAREISRIAAPVSAVSLSSLGVTLDFDAIENGSTYEENAFKKAAAAAEHVSGIIAADDSGLEVEALGGAPGLISARYGGSGLTDEQRCLRLLEEMRDIPDHARAARFVCVVAVIFPDGSRRVFTGEQRGVITRELRGSLGFGYDPVLFIPELGRTVAELDSDTKNRVSHRAIAFSEFKEFLLKNN